jgi:hypothetical protein
LASLESLEEPSWVRRPRLFVGVIHWSIGQTGRISL